ncbi:ulilysin [Yasminevirus sp. GU-2018]|uniref:Ulilysin n=1 Tax=Yasminevirus sp. GU-2018 TaxID=2420051 RepID=A0A5K0U893_9VIRU|nr:ulilysin [Yasminevirus sp. GU-2018]
MEEKVEGVRKPRICASHKNTVLAGKLDRAIAQATKKSTIVDNGHKMTINVVVHIMYQDASTPESMADVDAMIQTLNKDYNGKAENFDTDGTKYTRKTPSAKTYTDMLALTGSANIEFKLKDTVYKKMEVTLNDDDDLDNKNLAVKNSSTGSDAVNPGKCLNIWIVDNLGGGLLGYSTFPWDSILKTNAPFDPANVKYDAEKLKYDGVVIDKKVFGAKPESKEYNLNKTIVHEVGHWTGLYHTFQQGSIETLDKMSNFDYDTTTADDTQEVTGDCIIDTPIQSNPTYGNPLKDNTPWPYTIVETKQTVRSGKLKNTIKYVNKKNKSWHMFMNFMDYSDDECLFMFTKDQAKKMRLMLMMFRAKTITVEK